MNMSDTPGRPGSGDGAFRRLARDRRGATAAMFGVTLVVVVGFAGLATETGRWYDVVRDMQNAADMAAYAGARRIQDTFSGTVNLGTAGAQTQAKWVARDVSSKNGYPNSGANVVTPVTPYNGQDRQIEVTITRQEPRLISRLFLSGANQQISVRAVAGIQVLSDACVLALEAGLRLRGSLDIRAPDCVFASNSTANDSINVNGQPNIDVLSFTSNGGCNQCDRATLGAPATRGYTDDPLAWAANVALPSGNGWNTGFTQPPNIGNGNTWTVPAMRQNASFWNPTIGPADQPGEPAYPSPAPYYVFTSNVRVGTGETLILQSGTYFFDNGASLTTLGDGKICLVACNGSPPVYNPNDPPVLQTDRGVTLVFLRANNGRPGDVSMNGGIIQLQAPANGPYEGILLYRQAPTGNTQAGGTGGMEVVINGGADASRVAGAIYAPRADLDFIGNSNVSNGCLVLVAGYIDLGGNTTSRAGACNILNPNIVPEISIVRLIE
jgi:Flp pilus assembly protein TadG